MRTHIAWIITVVFLVSSSPLQAADATVKSFKAPVSTGEDSPATAPDLREGTFDGVGTIDRITDREVVINDVLMPLGPLVTYRHDNGTSAASDQFTVGTVVWYVLDSNDKVKALWLKGK